MTKENSTYRQVKYAAEREARQKTLISLYESHGNSNVVKRLQSCTDQWRCHFRWCANCADHQAYRRGCFVGQALLTLREEHPDHTLVLLTLNSADIPVEGLRPYAGDLTAGYLRLRNSRMLGGNVAWTRALEAPLAKWSPGAAVVHPHLHSLMLLPPCDVIPNKDALQLQWWRSSRVEAVPGVDLKIVGPNDIDVLNVGRYIFKPTMACTTSRHGLDTLLQDPSLFLSFDRQTVNTKGAYKAGGRLQGILSDDIRDCTAETELYTLRGSCGGQSDSWRLWTPPPANSLQPTIH